jgi:hypothetical protein
MSARGRRAEPHLTVDGACHTAGQIRMLNARIGPYPNSTQLNPAFWPAYHAGGHEKGSRNAKIPLGDN